MDMHERVDNDFEFHPASTEEKRNEHTAVRTKLREVAHFIVDKVPAGRERELALDRLEECMHWCNSGIAKEQ